MSTKYKHGDVIPTDVLANRLHQLGMVVTKGKDAVCREFVMRIPAELDYDADCVLMESADRMVVLERQLSEVTEERDRLREALEKAPTYQIIRQIGGEALAVAPETRVYIGWYEGVRRAALTPPDEVKEKQ